MTTLDDAAVLGLAVQGFLARPPYNPYEQAGVTPDVLQRRIKATLEHMHSAGVLAQAEAAAVEKYVEDGTPPDYQDVSAPLTTGAALICVVLYLHSVSPDGRPLEALHLEALHYAVEAAMDGALHGGAQAALVCAALGATGILRGIKS